MTRTTSSDAGAQDAAAGDTAGGTANDGATEVEQTAGAGEG